ncbi:beta-glucan synthesis-associated protein KRE6 [Lodderomyces elongisporus NRRL YB-4239]|uniref:Beta-glucan synthesis-associated protein KRE6 n=1 Tax=Lodderomyces elongisporus (strain ATCC 11503 / CBS 2605 / JCM 1781 / NBRC 1676 / NRRL YB-4239) TaxID=379508 RepID=A5DZI7_LODEL|nr:beta-glucan synthesis-associated protein KRE6 [Lodderomyces elongisporus NRRL YB-4239]
MRRNLTPGTTPVINLTNEDGVSFSHKSSGQSNPNNNNYEHQYDQFQNQKNGPYTSQSHSQSHSQSQSSSSQEQNPFADQQQEDIYNDGYPLQYNSHSRPISNTDSESVYYTRPLDNQNQLTYSQYQQQQSPKNHQHFSSSIPHNNSFQNLSYNSHNYQTQNNPPQDFYSRSYRSELDIESDPNSESGSGSGSDSDPLNLSPNTLSHLPLNHHYGSSNTYNSSLRRSTATSIMGNSNNNINNNNNNNSNSNSNNNTTSAYTVGGGSSGGSACGAQQYDRYPKEAFFGYANHSSQASASNLLLDDNASSSTFNYASSPNPISNNSSYDYEFSPFGGYPASQFPLSIDEKEPDDYLHNPDPVKDAEYDENRFMSDLKNMDRRSFGGLVALIMMLIAAILVFVLLPVLTFTNNVQPAQPRVYEILTRYKYPMLSAIRQSLVDPDTPESALTNIGQDGRVWKLVFSDEFNVEGRTFYDGDDQFFTAPDLHYAATQDLEWYDPDAVTTRNGTLELTLDAFENHNLHYRSGMVQSWNKMCYTQGKLEFSAMLPGYGSVSGLWPGLWSMGNLGRPGYLATTEGVWPYTYNSCDAGITPNQSSPDGISYLPGQRLNKCTCPGESHPNPGVGRGAPEIDALEGEIHGTTGRVSQSLQIAPYDIWYMPDYNFIELHNLTVTLMNTYAGGPFQQAVSGVTMLNRTWYEKGEGLGHHFQKYGYEFLNNDDDGYITWFVGNEPTFTMFSTALHPNGNIGWRQIPKEPISIIMNLGISNSWAYIDWPSLSFPSKMRVDYVRVYQPEDEVNMGCDPDDYPTYDYIQDHLNIYMNTNFTTFEKGGYKFPKNKLTGC